VLGKTRIESAPDGRRPISLAGKRAGEPSAGNRHAGFEVAGDGNQLTVRIVGHSQRKRGANKLGRTHGALAPVLDPTGIIQSLLRRGRAYKNLLPIGPVWPTLAKRRAVPFGSVPGAKNLALSPHRRSVFPRKFLTRCSRRIHPVASRGSWRATDDPWRERLWRQKRAPLDRFVRMKLDSAS